MRNENKFIEDYEKLSRLTNALAENGRTIVVTIGSWDMLHIGHVRYLMNARTHGDILVVGVDSDRAVNLYKGEFRPIVPQKERVEMLSYLSCVDYVTTVDDVGEEEGWKFGLIEKIKPHIYIAVEDSYPEEQRTAIKRFCGELVVLPRQAENTSTSNFVQRILKGHLGRVQEIIQEMVGEV
ncbi:MAG: adenylyltransferase/cytidyltransferase family protein [Candidatus Paceibacterota bacterium]